MKKLLLLALLALASPLRSSADEPSSTAYLFAYFVKNGEDGLHLAASTDGYTYETLNDGKSLLTPLVESLRKAAP